MVTTVHAGIHWYDIIITIGTLVLLAAVIALIWGVVGVIRRRTR